MNPSCQPRPVQLHPAADAAGTIRRGLLLLAIAVLGGGAWACVASLSAAIIAPGLIKVEHNRKTVQHREGGIVDAILIAEGEHVSAGQALIQLGDERVAAEMAAVAAELDAEMAKAARLEALSAGAAGIVFSAALAARVAEPGPAGAMRAERAAFESAQRALDEQLAVLQAQRSGVQQEISGLQAQSRSKTAATALMREEVRTHAALSDTGYISKVQVLRLQRGLQDYEAQRNEVISLTARALQRLAELSSRIHGLRSQSRQSAADELPRTRTRITLLEQQLRSSRDAARRQAIVAPVSGTVVGLKVFTVGGVIAPGAAVLDIVPDQSPLIVDARIDVDDVAHAQAGMPAQVRLSAYPATSAPLLDGTLRDLSADRLTDPGTGRAYYLAQVVIDPPSLRDAPGLVLKPGMAAEVFLLAGERTPLQYFIEPIRNSMRRALRQPA